MSTTIHIWKFPSTEPKVSIIDGPVADVATRTMLKVQGQGYRVDRTSRTSRLDGEVVSLSYTSGTNRTDLMTHWFLRPDEPWPMVDRSELTDVPA